MLSGGLVRQSPTLVREVVVHLFLLLNLKRLGDDTIAPRAIALDHLPPIEAQHTTRQEHDRQAVIVSNVAWSLMGRAAFNILHVRLTSGAGRILHKGTRSPDNIG